MSAWPTAALSTVCDIAGGGTPSRKRAEFYGGSIPWLTVKDLKTHYLSGASETITELGADNSATRILPVGSVVVATRISVGAVGVARVPVAINQDLKGLMPHSALDAEYLAWFLKTRHHELNSKASGSTVKGITTGVLAALEIPLPPLEEQRRIVGLLDRAAEIRRHADAARAKARAIIPALFLNTFGDPATNPKGWPTFTLGETINHGPQNGLYKPATDYGAGVRILRIDSFDDGTIAAQGALKRLRIDDATLDKFRLAEGDIVVNRVNSPPQLGKSVLIPRLEEPVVFESNMMRMRVNSEILIPSVLGVMLQLDSVRQALIKNAKHAINQSSINQGDVTGIMVLAPPIALQSVFAQHVRRIHALAHHLDAAAAKAEAMAAALSAEVFDKPSHKGNCHG